MRMVPVTVNYPAHPAVEAFFKGLGREQGLVSMPPFMILLTEEEFMVLHTICRMSGATAPRFSYLRNGYNLDWDGRLS